MKTKLAICCIALLALAMSSALAQSVKIDVADCTASSELGDTNATYVDNLKDDFLIDGSGLTDGEHTSVFLF